MATDAAAWPALAYESRAWERTGSEIGSRRHLRRAAGPYRAAVPLLIARVDVTLEPARIWQAPEVLDALDAFASRARRDRP